MAALMIQPPIYIARQPKLAKGKSWIGSQRGADQSPDGGWPIPNSGATFMTVSSSWVGVSNHLHPPKTLDTPRIINLGKTESTRPRIVSPKAPNQP
jgi:hypothetical protein